MGRRHNKRKAGREISGLLLLDKPAGLTSNAVLQKVKQLFNATKAGHTGSLDPIATGMLPICFGEGTKVSSFLLDSDKAYRLAAHLGERTTTGDTEGEVLESTPVGDIETQVLTEVLASFEGDLQQVPPMYSALKHNGERLYNLARQGIEVERKPRPIKIFSIKLLAFNSPTLELEVECSKGTYIRTLVEDIGAVLGCGAHVQKLHRLRVGVFKDPQQMVSFEKLTRLAEDGFQQLDELLLPVEHALSDWPEVVVPKDSAYYLAQGQAVLAPHAPTVGMVRLVSEECGFIGMGEIMEDGKVAPKRIFNIN